MIVCDHRSCCIYAFLKNLLARMCVNIFWGTQAGSRNMFDFEDNVVNSVMFCTHIKMTRYTDSPKHNKIPNLFVGRNIMVICIHYPRQFYILGIINGCLQITGETV